VAEAYGESTADDEQASPGIHRPFADLEALLKTPKK
jgi:hypothetical protein